MLLRHAVVREVDLCELYNAHPILEHVIRWPPPDAYLEENDSEAVDIRGS